MKIFLDVINLAGESLTCSERGYYAATYTNGSRNILVTYSEEVNGGFVRAKLDDPDATLDDPHAALEAYEKQRRERLNEMVLCFNRPQRPNFAVSDDDLCALEIAIYQQEEDDSIACISPDFSRIDEMRAMLTWARAWQVIQEHEQSWNA